MRSREWRVVRKKGNEAEIFKGDVRYKGSRSSFSADWARHDQRRDSWQARGHVRATRVLSSGDLVEAEGSRARLDRKTGRGSLEAHGPVRLKRTPAGGGPADWASGGRLDWEDSGRKARLAGNVRAWGPRAEAWASRADYDHEKQRLVFSGGRPVVEKKSLKAGDWTGAIKADTIVGSRSAASSRAQRMDADGRAVGWIFFASTRAFSAK